MGRQAPSQFPHPLYRGVPGTVGRQEQQSQMLGVLAQEGPQQHRVMIVSVVEHHDHATPASSVAQQAFEQASERLRAEHGARVANELAGAQIDRAEASDGLSFSSACEATLTPEGQQKYTKFFCDDPELG